MNEEFHYSMYKKANLGILAKVPGFMSQIAGSRSFLGGLAAPVAKLYGGGQKVVGRAQQGVAALRGGNKTLAEVSQTPLYQQGAKNVATGAGLRQQAGLSNVLNDANPLSYRIGRGVGAVGLGAPLMFAPNTLASYAGAASADPTIAKDYAMNMAEERLQERLEQFGQMPFLERLQSAWNPQKFTDQVGQTAPEAADLMYNAERNNINNPGILRYLASFNPFLGDPESNIRRVVRGTMMNELGMKNASEKQAMQVLKNALPMFQKVWRAGRSAAKAKPHGVNLPLPNAFTNQVPAWQAVANKGIYNLSQAPVRKTLTGLGLASIPAMMPWDYSRGQNAVYDQAAQDARAMADIQFTQMFNTPGLMGGLGRFGAALAPGMAQNMILNKVRQQMYGM